MFCSIYCVHRCESAEGITFKARRILLFAQCNSEFFLTVFNSLEKTRQFGVKCKKNRLQLLRVGALPLLIDLIANSKEDNVREQCLWALGNISADVNDCRDVLLDAGILPPLLWQLGIDSPPHRRCISPSLFTMRHVTWTCSNLVR